MSGKRRNKKRKIMQAKRNGMEMNTTMAEAAATVEADKPEEKEEKGMENLIQENVNSEEKKTEEIREESKPVMNLFLQYNDLEFSDKLMFEAAVNDYCAKAGVIMESIKMVNLYVKPQEGKAYYVINDDGDKTGSIDL